MSRGGAFRLISMENGQYISHLSYYKSFVYRQFAVRLGQTISVCFVEKLPIFRKIAHIEMKLPTFSIYPYSKHLH